MPTLDEMQDKWKETMGNPDSMARYIAEEVIGIELEPHQLEMLALAFAVVRNPPAGLDENAIMVEASVCSRDRTPFVTLRFEDHVIQLPPSSAWELATGLMRASEASTSDATLLKLLRGRGVADDAALDTMLSFRRIREENNFEKP